MPPFSRIKVRASVPSFAMAKGGNREMTGEERRRERERELCSASSSPPSSSSSSRLPARETVSPIRLNRVLVLFVAGTGGRRVK